MIHFKRLSDLHQGLGFPPPENPLISLHRCEGSDSCTGGSEYTSDFYMIGFKKVKAGMMLYGRTKYDHDRGSMSFTKPRQIIEIRDIQLMDDGFIIYVHEDFLMGHALHSEIKKYDYFEYETNEALHLSPKEEAIIWELYRKMETEYQSNQDEYSRAIMLTHLDSILKYSQRFYKRQFINRQPLSGAMITKFNDYLNTYFEKGLVKEKGLPTVSHMAGELHLSPKYLSDLLKQETGKTALELIHIHLIAEAKNLLMAGDRGIAEIAYELGFENPPYFSRLFKKEAGMTPHAFRDRFLN